MKNLHKNFGFVPALLLISSSMIFARDVRHKEYDFTADKRMPLKIRLAVDAGEVKIKPGNDDRDIHLSFRFDDRRYEVSVQFDEDENVLEAYFDIKKWFKDEDHDEKSSARLLVELPYGVPIILNCKTKAGETDIELGDLRIREFSLRVLAGETFLAFSKPNRERMKELTIETKIGELVSEKLGNANFEFAQIDGNIGELSIDLTGDVEQKRDREIDMSLNIGQTRVYLSKDDAVRFKVSKFLFLSNVDMPFEYKREGKYYYSENYDDAKYKTLISVSPGLGTLDIRLR
ncbi:MAG TPA: hypothetical protein ENH29_10055 [Bacteroidetes bacterium]|nr:hypothetical protein [Bacteroidota bacterium]